MHPMPWSRVYPITIPDGLRPRETTERDGVMVRVYAWKLVLAERERKGWWIGGGEARVERSSTGLILRAGVFGRWNYAIQKEDWDRLGLWGFAALDPDASLAAMERQRLEVVTLITGIACDDLGCRHEPCQRAREVGLRVAGMLPFPPAAS